MKSKFSCITTIDFRYRKFFLLIQSYMFIRYCSKNNVKLVVSHADRKNLFDFLFRKLFNHYKNIKIISLEYDFEKINNSYLRNVGVTYSNSEYVIFCDIDVVPDIKLFYNMIDESHNQGYSIIPVLYLTLVGSLFFLTFLSRIKIYRKWLKGNAYLVKHLAIPSSLICVKRKDFDSISGFDIIYEGHGYEDFDFILRIIQLYDSNYTEIDCDETYSSPLNAIGFRANIAKKCLHHILLENIALHIFHKKNKTEYVSDRIKNRNLFINKFNIKKNSNNNYPLIDYFEKLCEKYNKISKEYNMLYYNKKTGHFTKHSSIMYVTYSPKIRSHRGVESVLGGSLKVNPFWYPQAEGIVGWGHKPTADKARRYALKHDLPYIALEEGFLRSVQPGFSGEEPLSLVLDRTGIYYDATAQSDLEALLQEGGWESEEILSDAQKAMLDIIANDLSKYNHAPTAAPELLGEPDPARPRVLIIDQTFGDSSVTLGLASQDSFIRMLDAAVELFPTGRLFVKTHPDVVAGVRRGFLTDAARKKHINVIGIDVSPISLLSQADKVFCVTSQMGFEALMLGKPVWCFGMPFYAGWGLTTDALACPRRTRKRTIKELFAAAYILYPRYVDPITLERTDIHSTIRRLVLLRDSNSLNRGFHACFGYVPWSWKRPIMKAYLQSSGASFKFFKYFGAEKRAAESAAAHCGDVVAWSSKCLDGRLERACRNAGVPLIRMEDGFIRSIGLGTDHQWPSSLVLDRSGIYYDPTGPSDLEQILNCIRGRADYDELMDRAAKIRRFIIENGITKYNVGGTRENASYRPKGQRIILVPGQVEDDASVKQGGFGIKNNLALLEAVRDGAPDAYVIYKPHPDVEARMRKGRTSVKSAICFADEIVHDVRMDVLLKQIDEVHTLASLTGFEALMRGIKVTTYGGPFYAGWGLTTDMAPPDASFFKRRQTRLTLDELVAGTLLLYPTYYDRQTASPCFAEDICLRLSFSKNSDTHTALRRLVRMYRRLQRIVIH